MHSQLITVEQAQEKLLSQLSVCVQSESCSLRVASWRVLSEDIVSRIESPPANLSMMDGYALATGIDLSSDPLVIIDGCCINRLNILLT
jgi:molybdopterin molybdotransferase